MRLEKERARLLENSMPRRPKAPLYGQDGGRRPARRASGASGAWRGRSREIERERPFSCWTATRTVAEKVLGVHRVLCLARVTRARRISVCAQEAGDLRRTKEPSRRDGTERPGWAADCGGGGCSRGSEREPWEATNRTRRDVVQSKVGEKCACEARSLLGGGYEASRAWDRERRVTRVSV